MFPAAFIMTHNQLHIRGGIGAWLVDGGSCSPISNIARLRSDRQFDPKDVDYLEAQRGW